MKIAVLLSGGVDSSVALARLHEQGHELEAFYLKIWLEDELSFLGDCPWEQDLKYARGVCDTFGVPLHIVPLQHEYYDRIVAYTIAEVRAGRTPSPDILCNQRIKFGAFLDHIESSFDYVASGHYAQVVAVDSRSGLRHYGFARQAESGRTCEKNVISHVMLEQNSTYQLHRAPDPIKDQTYFLAHLNQEQLSRLILPIGDMTKQQVRAYAQRHNLSTKDRKDSQGMCFLGKISYNDFIRHYLGIKQGSIIEEETGKVVGQHNGFWFHTIGQRKGLGLSGGPWYVTRKDRESNSIYVSRSYHEPRKTRNIFVTEPVHWISGQRPEKNELSVKVRHGPEFHAALLSYRADGSVHVVLRERDQGLAPGQFAVFYDGSMCLGCGVIAGDAQ